MKKDIIINVISIVVFFVLWQISAKFGFISDTIASSPIKIIFRIQDMFESGIMGKHVMYSFYLLIEAILLSMFFGVIIGLFLYQFPLSYRIVKPFLYVLNSLPVLALAPVIILWFGFENISKMIIMLITALPPVIINTYSGAKNTDQGLLKMTSSFKINKISNLKHVIFFSAIPSIYSGFMIMIGRCIIGLVIADMFGYGVGLGYLLNFFNSTSDATGLFAMLIILLLINYLITAIFAIGKTLFIRRYHYEFE